jgi:hypothetical protein
LLYPAVHEPFDPDVEFALGNFVRTIVLAHVFLDKLDLGPEVIEFVLVIEAQFRCGAQILATSVWYLSFVRSAIFAVPFLGNKNILVNPAFPICNGKR